jgi:hypothetical protein
LLPALSVIAAAVLVRLARGLPFSNADQFELDEARRIGAAFVQIAKSLRALFFAALVGMLWLALAPEVAAGLGPAVKGTRYEPLLGPALSGSVGVILAYTLARMIGVVQGDVSLARLQSSLLEQAVQRKAAARFDKQIETPSSAIAGQTGFGRPLQ